MAPTVRWLVGMTRIFLATLLSLLPGAQVRAAVLELRSIGREVSVELRVEGRRLSCHTPCTLEVEGGLRLAASRWVGLSVGATYQLGTEDWSHSLLLSITGQATF